MTTELLSILQNHDEAYNMFTSDHINDTHIYQDILGKVVDPEDFIDINEMYSDYIKWMKVNKGEEVDEIYLLFKQSINTLSYRDVSTGLVLPLFEMMYLLRIGYTIDTVIKTVATFPETVEPIISSKRCEATCLSLIWPNRGSNVNLNAIHVESGTWNVTESLEHLSETLITESGTIIAMERMERHGVTSLTDIDTKKLGQSTPPLADIWQRRF